MNLQFENLVGKRQAKGELEEVVIAETARGNFRITPKVAAKLGISTGSFVTMQASNGTVYIGKGKDGVAKMNEDGSFVTDARGHRVYEKEGFGAQVTEINPGTNIYRLSVAAAWTTAGGNEDVKKVFELGEGVEATLPTDNGTFTTVMYPLVFLRDEAKQERVGTKKEADSLANSNALQADDSFGNTQAYTSEDL